MDAATGLAFVLGTSTLLLTGCSIRAVRTRMDAVATCGVVCMTLVSGLMASGACGLCGA